MTRDSDSDENEDDETRTRGELRQAATAFERLLRAVLERRNPAFARVRKLWLDRELDAVEDSSEDG